MKVAPGKKCAITLPNSPAQTHIQSERWLTITFHLKTSTAWADAGHELAWMQFAFPNPIQSVVPSTLSSTSNIDVATSQTRLVVNGSDFSFVFDRTRGCLTQWKSTSSINAEPKQVLISSILPGIWRAPTDNDVPRDLKYYRRFGVDAMTSQLRSLDVKNSSNNVKVTCTTFLSPPILNWGFETTTTYLISSSGTLSVKVNLKPSGSMPKTLPRVGIDLRLRDSLDQAEWFGIGPGEAYADKRSSQKLGIYSATVDELHTSYDVPQENGNRMDTRWVKMTDVFGAGVKATPVGNPKAFQWAAGRHSPFVLENARHPSDLVKENEVLWRLDAEAAGVGSAACGPGIKEEFQVKCDEKEFEFHFERVHA